MKQIPNIEEEIRHFCNAFAMTMPPSNEMMQATRNLRKLLPSFIHHQLQKARPEGYEQGYTQGKFDEKMDAEYKHPEELQKAREEEKERLFKNPLELFRGNRIKMTLEAREALLMAIDIIPDHSELDQDPVHDFFTAPEEVKRPVYERALAKTQEEQEKKLDQPTVKCGHHQAMLEGAAVGLDQDGKCIDCGAEVLRTDTNK